MGLRLYFWLHILQMRDGWFHFVPPRGQIPVAWSWDYDGASDVVCTCRRRKLPMSSNGLVTVDMSDTVEETPDRVQLQEFWNTLAHASGPRQPDLVMSGSARVVYQFPGKFEQDGLDHVAVQNMGLKNKGLSVRVNTAALNLPYNFKNVRAPGFEVVARAKMDIVLQQIRFAQTRLRTKKLLFVFIDDIYASVLADMFAAHPYLAPPDVDIHLLHYVSYQPRRTPLSQRRLVAPRVLFSPY